MTSTLLLLDYALYGLRHSPHKKPSSGITNAPLPNEIIEIYQAQEFYDFPAGI
jgi:hypothetical protein